MPLLLLTVYGTSLIEHLALLTNLGAFGMAIECIMNSMWPASTLFVILLFFELNIIF